MLKSFLQHLSLELRSFYLPLKFNRVMQPTGDVTAAEGHTVTLDCKFETSSSDYTLFWYKQEINDFPKLLIQHYISEKGQKSSGRFQTEIKNKSVPLKIQKLQVSDSAVYYCALRPTVTGNTKTLYKNLWSKDNTILHNIH
uniref:Ig-like domain-containing protein n=1 Tax=Seriola lalandi dorsalis TaxID=1841481 RepID=A0A3B4YC39_SERLL